MRSRARIIAFHLVMWEIHSDYQVSATRIGNSAVPFILEPDIHWPIALNVQKYAANKNLYVGMSALW